CFMILLGYLMISKWKFPSLKTLHFRVPSFHLILVTVLLAIFILYGIFYYFPLVLLVCSLGYILVGCILTLARLIAGKKSKTLVDFDIDDDKD
ncbi:MAG: phosphatidylcholine/phosphatidylserine synthase, partial [Chlamydiia bacterium]|nr:phosphatidylcholine/phosphatidylserine synthase [Chlamydiia bacterium]